MREPKLDLEMLDDLKAVLVVQCPECGDKSRFLLGEISTGTPVLCNCGGVLNLTGESLETMQQKADSFRKAHD